MLPILKCKISEVGENRVFLYYLVLFLVFFLYRPLKRLACLLVYDL